MDFMTEKQRKTRSKIIASHSNRDEVKRFASEINKAHELLKQGKIVSESDLGVSRSQFKNVLTALKARHEVDVLTITRGKALVGWILASEVLK